MKEPLPFLVYFSFCFFQSYGSIGNEDTLIKNGPGANEGLGEGYYDATHRALRVHWHDTIKRLVGRNKISEIIQHSSGQVNAILRKEGAVVEGIDPREVFVNGYGF